MRNYGTTDTYQQPRAASVEGVRGPQAWPRCRWAAAGPGRTTSRRAERSSQRGRRAGRRPRAHQAARHHEQRHGRAAAHGHTKQPGPTTGSSTARNTSGAINTARNTSGATHHRGIAKPPGPAGAGRLNQHQRIIEESRQCRDYRDRFPGARSRCRASMRGSS